MRVEPNISREALFERLYYNPHSDEQWEIHRSTARFRIPCCGRRWGKSTWASREMTLKMFVPDSVNWIVGPDYSLGEKEFRIVWYDFQKLGLLKYCSKSNNVKQGNMRIHFKELNSLLEVKSAERPDSLVGEGLDHVIMSEAAKHKMSTWQMYIEPALSDKRGSADFPSTPQGFNWFKGMYDLGLDPNQPEYDSWHFPTWTNTYSFPGGYDDPELVRIRGNHTNMFWDQEYAAKFTAYEGLIYQDFDPQIHVRPIAYQPQWSNYLALDFGYTDPTVCYDIMVNPFDQRVYVWREYVKTQTTYSEHGRILKNRENPANYHVDEAFGDPRGAEPIATLSFWLGYIAANAVGWSLGVEAVANALKVRPDGEPGLIIDPSCRELIRQMQALRAKGSVTEGRNERPGQYDGDDHGPDALRYFFNERFVLRSGEGLADMYDGVGKTEADTFFHYATNLTYSDKPGWYN